MTELARIIEALLFLSPEPVSVEQLTAAIGDDCRSEQVEEALAELSSALAEHGVSLAKVAGGHTLVSEPVAEEAARRLLSTPRTPSLTPAQAETLSVIAYLQPISRPEIARIRGVASESATASLVERGLIEETGRSEYGAVIYRTTPLFLKLFDLSTLQDLPDPAQWDPSPEEETELRERLLQAGDARSGNTPVEEVTELP